MFMEYYFEKPAPHTPFSLFIGLWLYNPGAQFPLRFAFFKTNNV